MWFAAQPQVFFFLSVKYMHKATNHVHVVYAQHRYASTSSVGRGVCDALNTAILSRIGHTEFCKDRVVCVDPREAGRNSTPTKGFSLCFLRL